MKKLLITSTLLICFIANSQCIKGDCDDGIGTKKYNLTGTKGTYEGEFKNKFPEGLGKYTYENFGKKNKIIFEGYFTDGEDVINIDGTKEGKITMPNGTIKNGFITKIIENNITDWKLNGKGEKKQPLVGGDFRIYKGNFINDILNDKNGEIEYANGNKYLGGVLNGKRQGIGKIITPEGGIQNDGNWFENDWIDANKNNPNAVPIFYNQSSIIVEVDFNGTKFPMVLDSGASTVVINKEIFYALVTLKQIKIKNKTDNSFEIANGDIVKGATYLIDKMKIGKYEIEDIQCSVLDNVNASNLLGLNALLAPSKSFSIDIEAGELTF